MEEVRGNRGGTRFKKGEDEARQGKKRTRDGGREWGGGGAKNQTKEPKTQEPKTKDLRKGPADGKKQKSKFDHVGLSPPP